MVPFSDIFTFMNTIIDGKVLYLAITDQLQVQWIVYTGILMVMSMCLISAAYVSVKTVDAVINWNSAYVEYHYIYANTHSS